MVIQANRTLPDAQNIKNIELKVPLRVFSEDGLLISEFGNERRKPTEIENFPSYLVNSVLASEDDNFYNHRGIDIRGLFRAAISNFRSGVSSQGASTITMQVARNFFLSPEKTYTRKLKEVLLSIKLEQILSKDEILSLYLNKIFLGHRAYGFGAAAEVYYGKELVDLSLAESAMLAGLPKAPSTSNPLRNPERAIARRNYVLNRLIELGKIDQLEFDEAKISPITAVKHAKQTEVSAHHIAEMVRSSLVEQFGEDAYWQGLNVYTTINSTNQSAAEKTLRKGLQNYDIRHGFRGAIAQLNLSEIDLEDVSLVANLLVDFPNSQEQQPVIAIAVTDNNAEFINKNGERLTLDIRDSGWAKRFLTNNNQGPTPKKMTQLLSVGDVVYVQPLNEPESSELNSEQQGSTQKWRLSQIPNISGAIISLEPSSGKITALVGGYDFFLNKYNRAVQSIRQPGSNIKPFIYSASLDSGFGPSSLISGAPIVITDPIHGTVWRPENYSGKFFGPTRMRVALTKSLNLVSIRLLRSIGIPYAREYVSRFGIDMDRFSSTLAMALGSGGVTPLQMVSAYGTLANTGYRVEPYFIDYITDRNGEVIYRAKMPELCDECYSQFLPDPILESYTETATNAEALADNVAELEAEGESEVETYLAPRVMHASNNFLTVSMLKDVIKLGTARKALVLNRQDLAGKTGTTNDYVDAWFTGFNSKIATTVWVGFDDPASMGKGEAGSVAALPIWVDYMRTALKDVPEDLTQTPEYFEERLINKASGEPAADTDQAVITEYFPISELLPEMEKIANALNSDATEATNDDGFELNETDNLSEPQPYQEQKIIEEDEDTEGLF